MAHIGVHPHERGRAQQLLIDLDMDIAPVPEDRIGATFDYERVRDALAATLACGHIELVESFAERMGRALLAAPGIEAIEIRVTKPAALAPDAEAAGVLLRMRRGRAA
ncbi:dihydroneopterin aldolase [Sphingomonas oleivorans]|uniref:Dihydroneopterin aldolase n=2 Tax=Sphingomonas oleivorans TaxID=1735121 RepID=A0A2T5G2Z8_9SPHN|nr:dihydroneopterin aldolase [Sphingomonas oleivorans]